MPIPFDELARLRDQEGLSYSEISRRVGISVAAVSGRFKRAGRAPLFEFKHQMSWDEFVDWFFNRTEPRDGHLIWTGGLSSGYGTVFYRGRSADAHIWAWKIHCGRFPLPDHQIHHECGVPLCVDWTHLREMPRIEHLRLRNRGQFVPLVPQPLLDALLAQGKTVYEAAEATGLTPQAIYQRRSRSRRLAKH